MQEDMREMLGEFIAESRELLESAQTQMVHLEDAEDPELVNSIFRALHTVKGSSGFLDLTAITRVSHAAEDLLNAVRRGQCKANQDVIDVLLQATDCLLGYLSQLQQGDENLVIDDSLVASLRQTLAGASEPAQAAPAQAPAAPAAQEATPNDSQAPTDGQPLSSQLRDMGEAFVRDTRSAMQLLNAALTSPKVNAGDLRVVLDELSATLEFFQVDDVLQCLRRFQAAIELPEPDRQGGAVALGDMRRQVDRIERLLQPDPLAVTAEVAEAVAAAVPSPDPADKPAPGKANAGKKMVVEQTLHVDVKRLDDLLNLVGELVLEKNHIASMVANGLYDTMPEAANQLNLITSELQMAVMKARMQPVDRLFGKYPRLVRDVARQCGKEVELVIEGAQTELDKSVIEHLGDPLVHLLRNAADHGIESPERRKQAGKSLLGRVTLSACYQGNHAVVSVADDGGGIDVDHVRQKAVTRGLITAEQAGEMSRRELLNLIFLPGFSLAQKVSDISGRGVGMDVVRSNVEQLGGMVDIDTELGQGTRISIRIPLTLAIVQALLTVSRQQKIAIPLANVVEIVRCDADGVQILNHQAVFNLRNRTIPIIRLDGKGFCQIEQSQDLRGTYLVVLTAAEVEFALAVDQLMRQEEVVIKPLDSLFRAIKEFSGAAILGDGSVTLIADVPALSSQARRVAQQHNRSRTLEPVGAK